MKISLTAFALLPICVQSFSLGSNIKGSVKASSTTTSCIVDTTNQVSRRNALKKVFIAPTVAAVTTSFSKPAFADVTNKVASQSSLRYIKRSIKEFEKLEFFAAQNDYSQIKQGIRAPGLSEIRKNAQVLIKAGEDGEEAENLQNAYNTFIKDVEALDGAASLGFRGRKGVELFPSYQKAVTSLLEFQIVASKSVEIPLKVESSE